MPLLNNNSDQLEQTPRQIIPTIAAILTLLFTICITITVASLQPQNPTSIAPISKSYSSILEKPDLITIEQQLRNFLGKTYNLTPEQSSSLTAVIREDTITNNDSNGVVFLIDISEPKLTFQVTYQKEQATANFSCPPIELAQSPDIFCIGQNRQSTIDTNLSDYLPYQGLTPNGTEYYIWQAPKSDYTPRLDIIANTCNNELLNKEVKSAIDYWLIQHGITNPDIIPTKISYPDCKK